MSRTSAPVALDVDEMKLVWLTPAPCRFVASPRVKESPVAFECRYWRTIDLPGKDSGPSTHAIVLGQVVGIHIGDEAIVNRRVDITRLKPIARLGYGEKVFTMKRPTSTSEV